jgi:glycosyltransferase involved in cell wall biosynthesis
MHIEYPRVDPIHDDNHRPFWSVMVTSYNRTEYLEYALKSILDQGFTPDEMQIEVVDDCSTQGNIEAIIREVGKGRVSFYRQPNNVGIYANWNTCIHRSRGYWVHILSDDDLVMPGFYEVYRRYIETYKCPVVLGQSVIFNEKGQWTSISESLQASDGLLNNALWILAKSNPIRTPGIVVAREVYEKVGGFTTSLMYTPDWEMWTRLAASVNFAYVNRPYSLFRMHSSSETSRLVLTADSVTDCLAASKIIQSRFSESKERKEIQSSVNHWLSASSFYLSHKLVSEGYYRSALVHATWVFRLTPSFFAFKNIGSVLLKILRALLREVISERQVQN